MKSRQIIVVCLVLLNTLVLFGQPGTLDDSFSSDGKVIISIGNDDDGEGVAIQSDGKIVVVGSVESESNYDIGLLRYNPDGTLDATFGTNGQVTTDVQGGNDLALFVLIQADGKILVAGLSEITGDASVHYDFLLVRYNTDGTLDTTFDGTGIVTTSVGSGDDGAFGMAIQADGKIVLGGSTDNGGIFDFASVRYNPDGSIDNSYGVDGRVVTDVDNGHNEGQAIAVQSNGKIILAGNTNNGINNAFTVVRYNADGTLDTTFGIDGIASTPVGSGDETTLALVLQADDKILLAGTSHNGTDDDYEVVRFDADGVLDNTFGTGGKVTTALGNGNDIGTSIALQSDGKIIVGGDYDNGTSSVFGLVRYDSDGTQDNTFGTNGIASAIFGSSEDLCNAITIQSDDNIVAIGESDNGTGNSDIAVARFFGGETIGVTDLLIKQDDFMVYPNPIQPHSILEYTLVESEVLSINLYDQSGRLIQNIVTDEQRGKGKHQESLNLNHSIACGVYVLRIEHDGGSRSVVVKW